MRRTGEWWLFLVVLSFSINCAPGEGEGDSAPAPRAGSWAEDGAPGDDLAPAAAGLAAAAPADRTHQAMRPCIDCHFLAQERSGPPLDPWGADAAPPGSWGAEPAGR